MPAGGESGRPLPPDLARLLHDLRGPLNSLTMHVEVMKRAVRGDAVAEDSARTVLEQFTRLAEMLPAAFAVASLELQTVKPVDLGAAVAAAARDSGGAVTIGEGRWPAVMADEALLVLALGHLLRNAVEATGAGTPAPTVSATAEDEQARVCVRDWGPGLPSTNPSLLIRLLHTTKPGHRGLGLVIAERVARLHRGSLRFESPPDGGALVSLTIPTGPKTRPRKARAS
jgi:signal transduction histidine kinase